MSAISSTLDMATSNPRFTGTSEAVPADERPVWLMVDGTRVAVRRSEVLHALAAQDETVTTPHTHGVPVCIGDQHPSTVFRVSSSSSKRVLFTRRP